MTTGAADAKVVLASTPTLLIAQMALLPVYLTAFLGEDAATFVPVGPFVHAFVWLIAVPLALAAAVQFWGGQRHAGERVAAGLSLLPVRYTNVGEWTDAAPLLDDGLRGLRDQSALHVEGAARHALGARGRNNVMQRRLEANPSAIWVQRRTVEHVIGTIKGWMGPLISR